MTPQNDLIQYAESNCLDRLLINVIIYFLIDRLLELGLYDCDVMGQVKVILTTQSIWSYLHFFFGHSLSKIYFMFFFLLVQNL